MKRTQPTTDPLAFASGPVRTWFEATFAGPTDAQRKAWPPISEGRSALLLAPTGSGKTLAAFLAAIQRLMFEPAPAEPRTGTRVLYVSPLKALGVDVERNLRAPLAGIRAVAQRDEYAHREPTVGIRSGDTSSSERAKLRRRPPDILITTPESLYLMLTSMARETLTSVETVIVDEIHTMAATKRGAHLFLSLERLEELRSGRRPLQRIGLSATQRPLEEIATLLGGSSLDEHGTLVPRPVEIVDAGNRKTLELTVEVPVEDMTHPEVVVEAADVDAAGGSLEERDLDDDAPATGPGSDATSGSTSTSPPDAGIETEAAAGNDFFADLGTDLDELPDSELRPGTQTRSIWPAIYPRLLEHVRAHRSTMIFVNSRRLAERLAAALNELAGEEIALAHHGSIAKDTRAVIEDRLKRGALPAIVATSSLELGIDMGAVDLVIQIEAPPTIASGMQRIGRSGHNVGDVSRGVIFPKYRGDLLACAAATTHMMRGEVEETRYPRNPLDVLAQQIVAVVAGGAVKLDDLYELVRRAAPFTELPRRSFEGVLDMLSGRYPSDRFAQFRARITWDRIEGVLYPREGSRSMAIINGGTIPDRGLYGVFLASDGGRSVRVGELDEEMVFEARPGEVFLLGASSWRIEEITHDRVVVTPAPGQPSKMPFWRGDRPGRPLDFGRAIGALARELGERPRDTSVKALREHHGLNELAAENLLDYLDDQQRLSEVPTDRAIVLERFLDEVGDWRVTLLSPFGGRVHAPWATAVMARIVEERGVEIDALWSDDGIVFRLPESDEPPADEWFFPDPDRVESLVTRHLANTPMFAARFRENAARALLLPRRRPGERTPLWVQRRRSADLLNAAADFDDFPILLETYRDCLRDVFDLPGLTELLSDVAARRIEVRSVATRTPSPFAASLMYAYVAEFLYEGDAPLAERRAQALSLDHALLRELLGEPELRELLDPDAIEAVEARLQRLDGRIPVKHADGLHDLLLSIGDLTPEELDERIAGRPHAGPAGSMKQPEATDEDEATSRRAPVEPEIVAEWLDELRRSRRVVDVRVAGDRRFAAAEDAALLRDALGISPPPGLPDAFLETSVRPLERLIERYARTHGPFRAETAAARFGLGIDPVRNALTALETAGRVVQGEFLPGGDGIEWCDAGNLRAIKQRSLAKLRKQVEPVEAAALGRFLPEWNGITRPRRGIDGLLRTIEQLQGLPLPATDLESRLLPARVSGYDPSMLDELCSAGEVVWRGHGTLGQTDGRVALYLRSHLRRLAPDPEPVEDSRSKAIVELLAGRGASFFADLVDAIGGFPNDIVDALWELVWSGHVTNDTLAPLRSRVSPPRARRKRHGAGMRPRFRSIGPPGTEGRWSLLPHGDAGAVTPTDRRTAVAQQLLDRHGVLTREAVGAEGLTGGFSFVYPVLKAMEEAGRVRRGYFLAGLGATQFALPGADDRLRTCAEVETSDDTRETLRLAAVDPANPYGAAIPWPEGRDARPQRAAGATVVLWRGRGIAWVSRDGTQVTTFLPETEPDRGRAAEALAACLATPIDREHRSALIMKIDGGPPGDSPLGPALEQAGFRPMSRGYVRRGQRNR